MGWFWHLRGHWQEGRQWLAPALQRTAAGLLAWTQDDYDVARAWLAEGAPLKGY
jgi:hypothetical protein